MSRYRSVVVICLAAIVAGCPKENQKSPPAATSSGGQPSDGPAPKLAPPPPHKVRQNKRREADRFLWLYTSLYGDMERAYGNVYWRSSTDVRPKNSGAREGAGKVYAAFVGNSALITRTKALLAQRSHLTIKQRLQLERILLLAAQYPGTRPKLSARRVEVESQASAALDSFVFCLGPRIGPKQMCPKNRVTTPNKIEGVLSKSKDLNERQRIWETAKEVGPVLKPFLAELRKLRNAVAKEMGYADFFALEVADYGMKTSEMMKLLGQVVKELKPLYTQIHCWVKHELAKKYKKPVPKRIPAHWLPNRWNQNWPGLVEGVALDKYFQGRTAKWVMRASEDFYVSMGFPRLPASFYKRSDLYPLKAGAKRKKNTHASAWHIDLRKDVRSLMSVVPNTRWFTTAHHELGHIYYFLAYSNPRTPLLLRAGANRSYHEGIGELIAMASLQLPYLRSIRVIPPGDKFDQTKWLLSDAMDSVVFIPWSAGVMSHFERDLYARDLPPAKWAARWWKYVGDFQGIGPPTPRDAKTCDACTKSHITDDPAQYYDYALATLLKFHLHRHICRKILKRDPHACNYRGSKAVGDFLRSILRPGRAADWRSVLRQKTGKDLSAEAMLEYYKPLEKFLAKENAGRQCGF